jgi:hypothetical protein
MSGAFLLGESERGVTGRTIHEADDIKLELPSGHAEVLLLSAARMPSASNLLKRNCSMLGNRTKGQKSN